MKTLAIISQKGGSGKTTLALNLACAAESFGQRAVVIDLDPQASAKGWHDHREKESPVVISAQASRIQDVLETARQNGADVCIVDTAPHSETAALAAARAADLVLIPCRPGILDLRGISTSVDLVLLAKRPALIVLNAVPPRGGLGDQAEHAIGHYGIDVATARISQRAAFYHSLTAGETAVEFEPDGIAAQEVLALYQITCKHVNMITSNKRNKEYQKRA
jgi:chromosome partitioning protein